MPASSSPQTVCLAPFTPPMSPWRLAYKGAVLAVMLAASLFAAVERFGAAPDAAAPPAMSAR